jgi:hypothetical protein
LSAYGENIAYLGRYGSQQLVSLSAHHDESLSETLKLFGDLDASLDRSGQLGTRFIGVPSFFSGNVLTTPSLPDIQSVDFSLNGRTYRFAGQAGAQLTMTQRDIWTFRTGYARSLFRSSSIEASTSEIFGSAAYDRTLDERTTVGGIITVRQSDYEGPGNVLVVTPQLTARKTLSPQTTAFVGVGLSFARIDNGQTVRDSAGLALNGTLCHAGDNDQLCASIVRDQQTSSIGGPVTSSSGSISYSRVIDANQSLQFAASVGRYSQSADSFVVPLSVGRSVYLSAGGSYSRKLGPRLYSGLNLSTRKLYRDGLDPKADASGSVFLRYRLGDLG